MGRGAQDPGRLRWDGACALTVNRRLMMLLSNQEYITAAGIHISMPVSGVVRVTDGRHSSSYMVCERKHNRKPQVEGTTLTWGKVSLQPENHMLLCYDGKPLCADYANPRARIPIIPLEEMEQVRAEGHSVDGGFRENWPVEVCKTLEPDDAIYGLGDKPGFLNKRNYAKSLCKMYTPTRTICF